MYKIGDIVLHPHSKAKILRNRVLKVIHIDGSKTRTINVHGKHSEHYTFLLKTLDHEEKYLKECVEQAGRRLEESKKELARFRGSMSSVDSYFAKV